MSEVALIGIDLGKHVFHLHAQDRGGHELWRKKVTRKQLLLLMSNFPRCTLVMEACAGSHCLARELQALGHEAKLIAPQYVKPFVKGNKNDFVDAEAICEAAARPAMHFVTPKTEAQQTLAALHRVREGLVRERTATVNRIHGILLEFGISLRVGMRVIERLPATLAEHTLPPRLVQVLDRLHAHFKYLDDQVKQVESELSQQLKEDDNAQRLLAIPGIGAITASLLAAELGDAKHFRSGRDFSASIGLVPRQYSTGGRPILLGISKRGDKTMRCLLIQCARAVMTRLHRRTDALGDWIRKMLVRRHSNVVACALANSTLPRGNRMEGTSPSRGCGGSRRLAPTCHDGVSKLHHNQRRGSPWLSLPLELILPRTCLPFMASTRPARQCWSSRRSHAISWCH